MKRHPALQQLSRDHHHALVVAQKLRRSDRGDADQARATFLEYWKSHGRDHFREEEETLLPTLARFADPDRPIVARVLIDHVRIRQLAAEVERHPEPAVMQALGRELEQHIRREERELFPLIEQAIPEDQLVRLVSLLDGTA